MFKLLIIVKLVSFIDSYLYCIIINFSYIRVGPNYMTYSVIQYTYVKIYLYFLLLLNMLMCFIKININGGLYNYNNFFLKNKNTTNHEILISVYDYSTVSFIPFFIQNIVCYLFFFDNVDSWFFKSTYLNSYKVPYTFWWLDKPCYIWDSIGYFEKINMMSHYYLF